MAELYRRVRVGRLKAVTAFVLVFILFFLTDYMRGSTGIATGTIATQRCCF